mmetsp:Transcript_46731/g.123503  ORF Transcript_46731/g.123503 Transcript_46731/m.123503 type:complete len:280 (+) Transcript_46731:111-950(+)
MGQWRWPLEQRQASVGGQQPQPRWELRRWWLCIVHPRRLIGHCRRSSRFRGVRRRWWPAGRRGAGSAAAATAAIVGAAVATAAAATAVAAAASELGFGDAESTSAEVPADGTVAAGLTCSWPISPTWLAAPTSSEPPPSPFAPPETVAATELPSSRAGSPPSSAFASWLVVPASPSSSSSLLALAGLGSSSSSSPLTSLAESHFGSMASKKEDAGLDSSASASPCSASRKELEAKTPTNASAATAIKALAGTLLRSLLLPGLCGGENVGSSSARPSCPP